MPREVSTSWRVSCLEISNPDRQLKLNPEIKDYDPVIGHLTASLWFRSKVLTIVGSTSSSRRPIDD